jgi:hypothetical protein
MSWKDDNFWKQVISFRGCGQNDRVARWGGQKILLVILLMLAIGVLVAASLDFF